MFFRKKERVLADKERAIEKEKKRFHADINKDIASVKKLNKVLSNGITLDIYRASHGEQK